MKCAHCDINIEQNDGYIQSGVNGTIFCSSACIKQAYQGCYAQNKINKTIKRYIYLKYDDYIQDSIMETRG